MKVLQEVIKSVGLEVNHNSLRNVFFSKSLHVLESSLHSSFKLKRAVSSVEWRGTAFPGAPRPAAAARCALPGDASLVVVQVVTPLITRFDRGP